MQEVQPSLDKSIHLFWSGDESPKSMLPGAKHLDPLLQMAQRHQPAPPAKGFLGMCSALGAKHVVVILRVTTLARLLEMPVARGVWDGSYSSVGSSALCGAVSCHSLHVSNKPGVILGCSWSCYMRALAHLARVECLNFVCSPLLLQPGSWSHFQFLDWEYDPVSSLLPR